MTRPDYSISSASGTDNSPQDALLTLVICQNNEKKSLKIKQISDHLAKILGRLPTEIEGQDFICLLDEKTSQLIAEHVEFVDDAADVDAVVQRISDFYLLRHNGEKLRFAKKINRISGRDKHHWFQLDLKDDRRRTEEQGLLEIIKQNKAGVENCNSKIGAADRKAGENYIAMLKNYINSGHISACMAAVRVDRYEKSLMHYGIGACDTLLAHVVNSCKSTFRDEDLVFHIGGSMIGLVLVNTNPDVARVVLNRLRWNIASHHIVFGGKSDFSVTVSLAFTGIPADTQNDLIHRCEEAVTGMSEDERSQLVCLD